MIEERCQASQREAGLRQSGNAGNCELVASFDKPVNLAKMIA
jgi:hypothetical protein